MKVHKDDISEIDRDITNEVWNFGFKRNIEDMTANLKPVAEAIDIV